MKEETKKMIEQEAEKWALSNVTFVNYKITISGEKAREIGSKGFESGATKYAEEVERLREENEVLKKEVSKFEQLYNITDKQRLEWSELAIKKQAVINAMMDDLDKVISVIKRNH